MRTDAPVDAQARDDLFRRAVALMLDQRAEEAETVARSALRSTPDDPELVALFGESLLMQGRWSEAWPFHESRAARRRTGVQRAPFPEWRGEPLDGRSILVWGEQGLGDEIQLARFLPRLRDLGASRITLGCHGLNTRALAQLGADRVMHITVERVSVEPHHFWVLLGSLPHRLGVTPESLTGEPYLSAPRGAGGVGLVERGNPGHSNDANRSLPPGSLQKLFPDGRLLSPKGDTLDSLSQVAGLDLLVTVDTSWAHMAGALGVPCWVLLPFRGLDCRWMRGRSDTPWYRSLRLFRQTAAGDWSDALEAVRHQYRNPDGTA